MPRERSEPERISDSVEVEKFYILAYEGVKSEPKYFRDLCNEEYFNDSGTIKIHPLPKKENTGTNPVAVKELLEDAEETLNFRDSDEYWMIIDFDDWEKIHNINLDKIAADCKKKHNFHMALSNPCFEIWLLLHLKDINSYSKDEQEKILKNKKISDSKNYIDVVLGNAQENGRGYNKRPNPNVFRNKVYTAIARAKELSKEGEEFPRHLGSDVYKLMEKLVKPINE